MGREDIRPGMRFVGLARVSSNEQRREGYSLAAQASELDTFAKSTDVTLSNGFRLLKRPASDKSARNSERSSRISTSITTKLTESSSTLSIGW
jgi:DNA invertase Pin-like site-specific DNA recombinase